MIEQALLEFGQEVAKEMQQELTQLNAVKTGTLYRSIDSYLVNPSELAITMEYYGPFVNDGHKTRLGTSQKPNYQPSPLHSQAFTKPKPFITNSVKTVIDRNLDDLFNKIIK
jgi:hypothetical protein